jgi:hypothetical protein
MFNVIGQVAEHVIEGLKKNDPEHSSRCMFPNRNFWGDYIRQRNEATEREAKSYKTSKTFVIDNGGGNVVSVTINNSIHIGD